MAAEDFRDDRDCAECGRETEHEVHYDGHERDSSGDWSRCLACGTMTDGWGRVMEWTRPARRQPSPVPPTETDPP